MRRSLILLSRAPKPRPIRTAASHPPPERPPPPTRPAESSSTEANAEPTSTVIRKGRPIVYAIGFALVTVTGAILGAQLKNTKQEHDKRRVIEAAAEELTTAASPAPSPQLRTRADEPAVSGQTLQPSPTLHPSYTVDIARQIALLNDRKALLKRQKWHLEGKIEKLRERKVRKEEMEAKRARGVKEQR